MECLSCGFSNRIENIYCINCGTFLKNKKNGNYCAYCGQKLENHSGQNNENEQDAPKTKLEIKDGERRLVTILFADLSNYTSMCEKKDPEYVRTLLNECYKIMSQIIIKYGGTIDKFIGDAMLALFGAAQSNEDDSARSVYAALDMQAKIEKYSIDNNLEKPLRFKIGICTGTVILGLIGSEIKNDYTVIGDAVNLASRLQTLAKPGQILVDESTFDRISDSFEFIPHTSQDIKGKERQVNIYEVISRKTKMEFKKKFVSKFIGREAELALLKKLIEESIAGYGQVVCITGDAGIGKSRLIYELKTNYLNKKKISIINCRTQSLGQTTTFLIFTECLKKFFCLDDILTKEQYIEKIAYTLENLNLAHIQRYIENLLGLEINDAEFNNLTIEELKHKTFESVKDLFIEQSKKQPYILFFEDLHWMDRTSYELLTYLIENIRNASILIICNYRPEFKQNWHDKRNYSQICLKELSRSESSEMIKSLLKNNNEMPAELEKTILEKSDGNPFYIEEILQSLLDIEYIIFSEEKGWQINLTREVNEIPNTINGIIMSRIDRMPSQRKKILQYASVIGRAFQYKILNELVESQDMEEQLKALQNDEIIYLTNAYPDKEYIFKHMLTQEIVYNNLLISKRNELHNKIALIIEQLFLTKIETYFELLAFHFFNGLNYQKALEYSIKSGDKAQRLFANELAIEHYRKSIEISEKINEVKTAANMYEKIGKIYFRVGNLQASLESYQNAIKNNKIIGEEKKNGSINFEIGRLCRRWGRLADAEKYFFAALEIAKQNNDNILSAYIYHRLVTVYKDWGMEDKAAKYSNMMIELSKNSGDKYLEMLGYGTMGYFMHLAANYKEAKINFNIALEIAYSINSLENVSYCMRYIGRICFNQSDYEKAIEYTEKALDIAKKIGFREAISHSQICLGNIYIKLGKMDKAQNYITEALKSAEQLEYRSIQSECHNSLGIINRRTCDYRSSAYHFNKSLSIARHLGNKSMLAHQLFDAAVSKRDIGEINEAYELYNECLDISKEIKDESYMQRCYNSLGSVDFKCGNYTKALEQLEYSLNLSKKIENKIGEIYSYNILSEFWNEIGDFAKATEYAEIALNMSKKIGNRDSLSVLYIRLANSKATYWRFDNYKEATEYYNKALDIANETGVIQFQSLSYYHLAYISWGKGEIENAKNYTFKAFEINEKSGNKFESPRFTKSLGILMLNLKKYDEAIKYFNMTLTLAKIYRQKKYIIIASLYLAQIFEIRNDMDTALKHYESAILMLMALNDNMTQKLQEIYWSISYKKKFAVQYIEFSKKINYNIPKKYKDFMNKIGVELKMI